MSRLDEIARFHRLRQKQKGPIVAIQVGRVRQLLRDGRSHAVQKYLQDRSPRRSFGEIRHGQTMRVEEGDGALALAGDARRQVEAA